MDEATIKKKVDREMWFQHGERIQLPREHWEAFFRAPDYEEKERRMKEEVAKEVALWRPMMAEAQAKAKELGIEDWFPIFRAALDRLEEDRKLKRNCPPG